MRSLPGVLSLLAAALIPLRAGAVLSPEEFPFEFREGLICFQVRALESAEPLTFLLDSGAGLSVVNLPTAQHLGLNPGRPMTVQGVGASAKGYWPLNLHAQASGVLLPQKYLAVDLSDLSGACAFHVDGLIGIDFFRNHVVEIDFSEHRIRLDSPDRLGYQAISLRTRAGALLVRARVNDHTPQWLRLDTGCASPLQWVTGKSVNTASGDRLAVGLAELAIPMTRTTVQLGAAHFESVPTGLHRTPIFASEGGLLGNGLLSRFDSVTIDASHNKLWLGQPVTRPQPVTPVQKRQRPSPGGP